MTRYYYIVPLLLLCAAWMSPGRTTAPVHLKTTWGAQAGGPIDTNMARALLDTPLSVTDDKGVAYTITRFRFSYHKLSTYQDSTGKVNTTYQLFTRNFYDTPRLDTLWSNNIAPTVRPGETFLIDNVIVRDAKGAKSFVPGLQLDIQ